MTIPTIPAMTEPVPTRADRASFAARADVTLSELPPTVTAINAAIAAMNITAAAVDADAAAADLSALAALAAANYKGEWSALSGALAIPAAVSHNSVVYILLSNTANVALITPGVSGQWLAVFSVPLYHLPIMQANAGYAAASAMEVLGIADFDSLLTGVGSPGFGTYSGSNYVVTAYQVSASVATSPDGETWTLRAMPSSTVWGPIASNGAGKVMAFVPGTNTSAISTNHGVTWANCAATAGLALVQAELGVHYVGGLWVVPAGNGVNNYYTSADDGASWTGRTLPSVAPSTSQFCMVGSTLWFRQTATATTAYTTTDGINWTTRTASVPAGTMVPGTYPDGSLWGCIGNSLYRTTDGITWTLQSVQTPVSGALPAEVNGIKLVMSSPLVYTHDQGTWSARAKGVVTAVDLSMQYSVRSFKARGHVNGLFMQLGHLVGRVALIKPGAGSASGLFRKV
jgi:hypothetical protein